MQEKPNKQYQEKLITAAQAAAMVKSGDWVEYGWCCAHTMAIDKELAKRSEQLCDINVRGGICLWVPEIAKVKNPQEHFTWNSWHMSSIERKLIEEGMAFYNACRYSELPSYYRDYIIPGDIAFFQVAPMDDSGYFNFGPNASHMIELCKRTRTVVVEVNTNMPVCHGNGCEHVHISEVDYIVEGENPPIAELAAPRPSEVDNKIAALIIERIRNGVCLQLGIGGMPNAIGEMIATSDLKDLGVHTEMYVDAFVEMSLAGRINGSKKAIDKGLQTFTFAAGSKKLYDFINKNPELYCVPVDYVNDVRVIGQLDNFVSITSAVDMDLFGQVNGESAGMRHISGSGGQFDFVMGSGLSKGGLSFICLPSTYTAKTGEKKSRILPTLATGTVVTTLRPSVQHIVTEYGIICLKGKSSWQRAEDIVSIAHPDFRDELIKSAWQMGIWKQSNKR